MVRNCYGAKSWVSRFTQKRCTCEFKNILVLNYGGKLEIKSPYTLLK